MLAVCPAEAPDLNGFGKFQYFRGVYISEGGVLKALWLELVNREHVRGREPNYLHLFAASQVTPEMLNSVVNRGPAGQGFEQRRSRGGWVVQGPRPKRVCMGGWVWQEPLQWCCHLLPRAQGFGHRVHVQAVVPGWRLLALVRGDRAVRGGA